jgi:hypothetical protein
VTPEISEFSYGFALTNEIVGWAPITAAPLFPSLIEEGKAGGGYDVKLDMPAVPLYLQFKRADCMIRRSVREICTHNLPLLLPFYRFKITESGRSDQHELLLALDDGSCLVFYAAPRFHELSEINNAWSDNVVATRSIFVAPSRIGPLDTESHHIAYDEQQAWLCSDPQPIDFLNGSNLIEELRDRLEADSRPLREKISELLEQIYSVALRAHVEAPTRRAPHDPAGSCPTLTHIVRIRTTIARGLRYRRTGIQRSANYCAARRRLIPGQLLGPSGLGRRLRQVLKMVRGF